MRSTRKVNQEGLLYLGAGLQEIGVKFVPSYANFIIACVMDGQQVFNELRHQGTITRPMGGYGLPEWIRISIGNPDENARCLELLKKVM